jgi:PAS domain S-box-containing protein
MKDTLTDIFPGGSEMARMMREHDWEASPLGCPERWPDALKISLRMLLTTRFEMWLGWGPDLQFFYNDAYIPTLGIKHPTMLGRPLREVWSEVYDEVADQVARVRAGESTWNKALLLLLERSGYPEETYHSFSYSPLYDAQGTVQGLLCVVNEETARIVGERRLETLRQLGLALAGATSTDAVRAAVQTAFATNRRDFPFVALRLSDEVPATQDRQVFADAVAAAPNRIDTAGQAFKLPAGRTWPTGDWDRSPEQAVAIAIPGVGGSDEAGALVIALNPYRGEDPDILNIVRLFASQISLALANVAAIRAERRRADRMWSVSRDLMVVVDDAGVFRSVGPSWTRILGHPADEVVGQPFAAFMHPDDIVASSKALADALGSNELTSYENRFQATDGSYHHIEWHTTLEDGLVYAYGRDVTERRQVEAQLNAAEEQFRHLVQGVTDYAIYRIDAEGYVSSWNEGARRIKGYEPEGDHRRTLFALLHGRGPRARRP